MWTGRKSLLHFRHFRHPWRSYVAKGHDYRDVGVRAEQEARAEDVRSGDMHVNILCMSHNSGFPPIAKPDAKILILGSMPGQKSLEENQYYAHPRNSFWPIICNLFSADKNLSYKARKNLLLKNKIALWDVLKSCHREGSLDSDIDHSTIEPNDFKRFFSNHTKIKTVFFNGTKAEQLFNKNVLKTLGQQHQDLAYYRLPSTSPAHAAMTMEQKLKKWEIIKIVN